MNTPKIIHIGSGKSFKPEALNIDINPQWNPDIVKDMGEPFFTSETFDVHTERFGDISISKHYFERIIAHEVLEHVPDLLTFMKNALDLLEVGGVFDITVPYDLSLGAWQDPTHIRAFNENSWLYYTDWFWYLGWDESRFITEKLEFKLSPYGIELNSQGKAVADILRKPRAVDSMHVYLKKVLLSEQDRATLAYHTAQNKKKTSEYSIWVVSPNGFVHARAFDEVALGLQAGFRRLNIEAPIVYEHQKIQGKPIVLGCNLLPKIQGLDYQTILPRDSIMFNLEVIQDDSTWVNSLYLELLKRYEVWDYSEQNIKNLESMGVNAKFCGMGYEPELTKIKHLPEESKDIDVLFYGSMNDRRKIILDELSLKGLKVVTLFGVYGDERDACIARAKIIINIHYYEAKVFEIVRVSYLLANRCFVISEIGNDKSLEEPYKEGMIFAAYESLVDKCFEYLNDNDSRNKVANAGFEIVSTKTQSRYIANMLNG